MCLVAQGAKKRWYLDSGCSRHMIGDKDQFVTLKIKEGGVVTFRDNGKGHIVGFGKIKLLLLLLLKMSYMLKV